MLPFLVTVAILLGTPRSGRTSDGRNSYTSGPFVAAPAPVCRETVRTFNTLRDGDFDFCRLRLRYEPGSNDCARSVSVVCTQWVLDQRGQWVQSDSVDNRTLRTTCPPGPVPPSCPSDLPDPY